MVFLQLHVHKVLLDVRLTASQPGGGRQAINILTARQAKQYPILIANIVGHQSELSLDILSRPRLLLLLFLQAEVGIKKKI